MRKLQYMVPYLKIEIVYEYLIHTKSKKEIATVLGVNYPSVLCVIRSFEETGRIFKLLPLHSKLFILKNRMQSIESQRLYRAFRKKLHTMKKPAPKPVIIAN